MAETYQDWTFWGERCSEHHEFDTYACGKCGRCACETDLYQPPRGSDYYHPFLCTDELLERLKYYPDDVEIALPQADERLSWRGTP